jgi:hypothetical protein
MQNFAHGQSYVTNSRTRLFKNLGFLHAKVKPGEKPCFINVVCQRALGANVLHVQQREADEKKRVRRADEDADADSAEDSSSSDAPVERARKRQIHASALRRTALSLKERRMKVREEAMRIVEDEAMEDE